MPSYKNGSVHGPGYLDPASKDLLDVHMSMREESDLGADPIRVVIADQDHIFIEGVASLLKEWEEFELVGKAFSLEEAFELCSREKPAFIMMGVTFKGESCAPTVKRLCDADPHCASWSSHRWGRAASCSMRCGRARAASAPATR